MKEFPGQNLVILAIDLAQAFRRQWLRGVYAGVVLALILFVLALLLMDGSQ